MEFYLKVVSFGLLLSLSILNEVVCDCYYSQVLEDGQIYYIYNPYYPHYYIGETCRWEAKSSYEVIIECSIDIPPSNYYYSSHLSIQSDDKVYLYSGKNNFIFKSMNPIITLYSRYSESKVLCSIQTKKPDEKPDNCQCGWKKNTRIVGGEETGINEFPYMCGFFWWTDPEKIIFCGCTIIADQYVVTAAHCMEDKNITNMGVVVGEHDINTQNETNATKWYRIIWYKSHPKYNDIYNDIAVCKIDGTITYSNEVGPVCLPFQQQCDRLVGEIVTALGWGLTEFMGGKPSTLQKVDLEVIPLSNCSKFYNVNEGNMCTFTEGKDACQMDSGGPFLWYNSQTGRYILVGITSAGAGCASEEPGIETCVRYFLDWIQSVTPDVKYCKNG